MKRSRDPYPKETIIKIFQSYVPKELYGKIMAIATYIYQHTIMYSNGSTLADRVNNSPDSVKQIIEQAIHRSTKGEHGLKPTNPYVNELFDEEIEPGLTRFDTIVEEWYGSIVQRRKGTLEYFTGKVFSIIDLYMKNLQLVLNRNECRQELEYSYYLVPDEVDNLVSSKLRFDVSLKTHGFKKINYSYLMLVKQKTEGAKIKPEEYPSHACFLLTALPTSEEYFVETKELERPPEGIALPEAAIFLDITLLCIVQQISTDRKGPDAFLFKLFKYINELVDTLQEKSDILYPSRIRITKPLGG